MQQGRVFTLYQIKTDDPVSFSCMSVNPPSFFFFIVIRHHSLSRPFHALLRLKVERKLLNVHAPRLE
jgi:hypothetical protein